MGVVGWRPAGGRVGAAASARAVSAGRGRGAPPPPCRAGSVRRRCSSSCSRRTSRSCRRRRCATSGAASGSTRARRSTTARASGCWRWSTRPARRSAACGGSGTWGRRTHSWPSRSPSSSSRSALASSGARLKTLLGFSGTHPVLLRTSMWLCMGSCALSLTGPEAEGAAAQTRRAAPAARAPAGRLHARA